MRQKSTTRLDSSPREARQVEIALPQPRAAGDLPLEECLRRRRSCRIFTSEPVAFLEIGQLLWAAQGVTGVGGLRTAPSAGASYPLETYLAAANVDGLGAGVYLYDPDEHRLKLVSRGDKRRRLVPAAAGQECVGDAAAAIVLAGVYRRMLAEFGTNAARLTHMEAGHVMQNVSLQAAALGLGSIGLGRIDPPAVRAALHLPEQHDPLAIIAIGHKWE